MSAKERLRYLVVTVAAPPEKAAQLHNFLFHLALSGKDQNILQFSLNLLISLSSVT